ncbi:hypothetical protein MKW94_022728 [Papaver nudicaule]|uniref:Uncharacterized protein n=1 Tax=Papaver nudicaule TaxID=74823 RepID=A0AA41RSI0_PAPNU|nr:hypothetical protein [Papaver nudicaule]
MITRKCYNDHEDVNFRGLCGDVTMEDSFQPPLPDYYAPDAADQQKQIEEGYASDGYVSEDASYTSSISYVCSEEASSVSSSGDGASEDVDLANEVGDVASKDEEGAAASIDGGGQMYDEYSNPDSSDEDTSDGDTSDDFTGPFETNFEKYDHMSDKEDDAYDKAMKAFKTNKPTKEDWIKTWPEGRKEAESAWVNVYSHFEGQGELGCGGYAVIVRNMSAQPIAASANFSKRGKSYFFHVLDGIQAGLRLASEHGCSSPDVRCSSRTVVMLLWQLASGGCIPFYENCKGTKKGEIGEICETCTMAIVPSVSKHAFVTSAGLLGELRGKLDSFDIEWEREMTNKAAHYLAKEVKKEGTAGWN